MTWAIDEGDMARQDELTATCSALYRIRLSRVEGGVRIRSFTCRALVELGVGIAELDRNVSQLFSEESDGIGARDGSNKSTLTVGHMADGADVDGGLSRDNLRVQRRHL